MVVLQSGTGYYFYNLGDVQLSIAHNMIKSLKPNPYVRSVFFARIRTLLHLPDSFRYDL